jgi:cell division cycle 2-like
MDTWSCYDYEETRSDDGGDMGPVTRHTPSLGDLLVKRRNIGRGAQGAVYEAVFKGDESGTVVVVKRLVAHHQLRGGQGVVTGHLRELTLLQSLRHENIVRLHRVVSAPQGEVCLVLERYATDLEALVVKRRCKLSESMLKRVTLSLLNAVQFLGSVGAMHRDIKPSNVGLTDDGVVKLCDFGSARFACPQGGRYTPVSMVTTLPYAAPELLLGSPSHSPAVDVWGVGVVLAELALQKHLFTGRTQLEMLSKIFKTVGTPTDESWPEMATMPACQSFRFADQPSRVAETLHSTGISAAGVDLLTRMLDPSPTARISVADALAHHWLAREIPEPASAAELAVVVAATAGGSSAAKQSGSPSKQHRANAGGGVIPAFADLGDGDSDDDEEHELF